MIDDNARIPPQAIEVEESVLGSCFIEHEALEVVIGEIGFQSEIFYKPAHSHIFESVLKIYRNDGVVDLISVENDLRDNGLLATIGGSEYLGGLTRRVSSSADAEKHCKILIEKWLKRRMIMNSSGTIKRCYDPSESPYDILDQAMTNMDFVANKLYRKQGELASDMMKGVLEDIEARRENPGITGIRSGLPIDKYTGGWQPGKLYIIGARPSIGKTAFIIKAGFNAALFSADKYRTNVFYSNLEMKNSDVLKRRLAIEAKVSSTKMRDGKLSDIEMKRLVEASGFIFDSTIILDETAGIGINEFRAKYKTAVRRHDVRLGIIDYLQLMSGDSDGNREQEISSISRGLKAVAKETNTAIVALSQLSRACENREGAEPFLSDLRESGSLEQDADGVILLNRPEFFGKNIFKNRQTEGKGIVKIAKMRDGMTGEIWMNFEKQFAEWVPEHAGDYSDSPADGISEPKASISQSLFEGDENTDVNEESPF